MKEPTYEIDAKKNRKKIRRNEGEMQTFVEGGGRCILFRFGLNNDIKYYTYNI